MSYKRKKAPDFTSAAEKDLIIAVGGRGFVNGIAPGMYDVEYRGEFFSVVDDGTEGMRIVKTFCSRRDCRKELGISYSDALELAGELDFTEERTRDMGKCIIMDLTIPAVDIEPKRIRNVFEQILAATEVLMERVSEKAEA